MCLLVTGLRAQAQAPAEPAYASRPASSALAFVEHVPPLTAVIDSALANSPLLREHAASIAVTQHSYEATRAQWTKSLKFRAGYAYGSGQVDFTQQSIGMSDVQSSTDLRYDVGVLLSVSPGDWIVRKKQLNLAKAQIAYEQARKDGSTKAIVQQVISQYNDVLLAYETFLLSRGLVESFEASVLLAERQFREGVIDIVQYNDMQWKYTKVKMELEATRKQLREACQQLEVTVGVPLSSF